MQRSKVIIGSTPWELAQRVNDFIAGRYASTSEVIEAEQSAFMVVTIMDYEGAESRLFAAGGKAMLAQQIDDFIGEDAVLQMSEIWRIDGTYYCLASRHEISEIQPPNILAGTPVTIEEALSKSVTVPVKIEEPDTAPLAEEPTEEPARDEVDPTPKPKAKK